MMNSQWDELFGNYTKQPSIELRGLPEGSRCVFLSDLQVPFEDRALLNAIHKFARQWKPKSPAEYHLFIVGDAVDEYSISKWSKNPLANFTLKDELIRIDGYLKVWDSIFGKKHFAFGNHEERLERYLWEKAPELADFSGLTVADLLNLKDRGWDWVPYSKHYDVEGFIVTHGETTVEFAAKKMLSLYHSSGVSGHTNRPQSYTFADAKTGEPITWYNIGMLCRTDIGDVIPAFRRLQSWQQGFGVAEVHDGVLHFELVRVHHDGFRVSGKFFNVHQE